MQRPKHGKRTQRGAHQPKNRPTVQRTRRPRQQNAFARATNSPLGAGIILLLGAMLFGLWAFSFDDFRTVMSQEGLPVTDATVLEVREQGRNTTLVEIEFVTETEEVIQTETEEFYLDPYPEAGDVQAVRYDPEDPEYYVQDVRLGNGPGLVILLTFLSGLFALGGILSFLGRLPAWVLQR